MWASKGPTPARSGWVTPYVWRHDGPDRNRYGGARQGNQLRPVGQGIVDDVGNVGIGHPYAVCLRRPAVI